MDGIFQLSEWAKTILGQVGTSPVTLPFAFILGLASAVASSCCALPVLGAVVGYAGIQENIDKRSNLLAAIFFMIGTIFSLLILGSVAGLIVRSPKASLEVTGRFSRDLWLLSLDLVP